MNTGNTWPGGVRHAMDQNEHERWNASNYPGTLQLCQLCDEPTGRCEDDSIYIESNGNDIGPLCSLCVDKITEWVIGNSGLESQK